VRIDVVRRCGLSLGLLLLSACASAPPPPVKPPVAVAKAGGYKVGQPYQIGGQWFYPAVDYEYDQTGIGSWYGPGFHAKVTANGEIYNENELTAAHQTLPMPSLVRVTNLENGRSIVVRINDRGPYAGARIIDMSRRSAQLLGFEQKGTAKVRVQILADESRAIAAAAQNATVQVAGVASDGGPKPIAAPRPTVQIEGKPLGPPTKPQPDRTILAPTTVAGRTTDDGRFLPAPVVEQRTVTGGTQIYVQAGAFTNFDNANKLRARLTPLGKAGIQRAVVKDVEYFRVRVGPLESTERADQVLTQVVQMGSQGARVVID
jgi:rare lipoprotein A